MAHFVETIRLATSGRKIMHESPKTETGKIARQALLKG
jgi:hypothetical protein